MNSMNEREWSELEHELTDKHVHSSLYQLRQDAKNFDIKITAAAKMRIRYLQEQLTYWIHYLNDEIYGVVLPSGEVVLPYADMDTIIGELVALSAPQPKEVKKDSITDEMIEEAKKYPVDKLIEFKSGKTKCFNHADKAPSMFFGFRLNLACCPVCDKTWDSIQILIDRDGRSFRQAVKELCG